MKRDLYFEKPLMNAAGSLGFAPDFRILPPSGTSQEIGSLSNFGAFVTNPFSLRPRLPTARPTLMEYPGGFLLHTGLPNPGLNSALKKYAHRWEDSSLPIIVHLVAGLPEETKQMVQGLENVENVMGVELGFAPLLADDIILLTLEMCMGELPLIFSLPDEQILSMGPRLMDNGAQAISVSSPRGSFVIRDSSFVSGRLYGRSLFPRALDVVRSASKLGLPIIGAGGIWNEKDAEDMLSAGAMAVQLDASLWVPREADASL